MVGFNGRWRVPDESGKHDDPDKDFPFRQAFTDCSGQERSFVISYFHTSLGFGVQAEEEGKEGQGFFFREFDATSPYLALGRLQRRIRKALATRHIEQQNPEISRLHTRLCEGESPIHTGRSPSSSMVGSSPCNSSGRWSRRSRDSSFAWTSRIRPLPLAATLRQINLTDCRAGYLEKKTRGPTPRRDPTGHLCSPSSGSLYLSNHGSLLLSVVAGF